MSLSLRSKVVLLMLLCTALFTGAQTTPNYGFQVPPFNAPNWNVSMNQNWFSLDSILSGFSVGSPNGLQCKPLATFGPPPTGAATIVCMSDAQPTNPCTTGGSGALAIGLNGSYNCAGGSGPGGGLADPGSNGIMTRTALNVTQPAVFADLAALVSGAPTSAFFLRGDGTWAAPPGSGVTSCSNTPGTLAGYFGTSPSTQVKCDPNSTSDFAGHINLLGIAANVVAATGTGANGPIYANAGSGTTVGLLAKLNTSGQALTATTVDTSVPVFLVLPTVTVTPTTICAPGTTGNVCLGTFGQANCTVDAAGAIAGDFVGQSTATNGRCMDLGAVLPASPACIVGTFAASGAANASVLVNIEPSCYTSSNTVQWEIDLPFAQCTGVGTAQISWDPPPSGAAMTPSGCNGTNQDQGLAVAINSGTPALQYSFRLPQNLTGAADIYLTYASVSASAAFTVVVDAICNQTNGTVTNDPAFSAGNFFAPGAQTTPGTLAFVQTISSTGIAWPASCVAGAMLHLRAKRTDTSTATAVNFFTLHIIGRKLRLP